MTRTVFFSVILSLVIISRPLCFVDDGPSIATRSPEEIERERQRFRAMIAAQNAANAGSDDDDDGNDDDEDDENDSEDEDSTAFFKFLLSVLYLLLH